LAGVFITLFRETRKRISKTALRCKAVFADFCGQGSSQFFTHAHWDLETTMTTFKSNIILRTHLEHSELWQFEDRQMGAGELDRAPKASCFKELFPIIRRLGGELRALADIVQRAACPLVGD